MVNQIVMAFNRLAVVVVPSWSIVSKRRHVVAVTVAVFPVCIALALLADVFLPCCTLYYYYGRYGLKYIGEGRNYANEFISLPINVVCSTASIVCYVIIFAYVWKTKSRVTDSINDKSRSAIRKREVRYALQFALLTLFLLFEWVSVRIFPKIVPPEVPQLYVVTTFLLLAHCLSNSLVLVTMNQEFKVAFGKLLVLSNKPTATHITSTMMPTLKPNYVAG
ncbi:Protein SRX-2 [Aphelenchoides avenae]|nr:Protein SRX-2 [Aphelenchus avenae]